MGFVNELARSFDGLYWVHDLSCRKNVPYRKINRTAITPTPACITPRPTSARVS